jgi:hypothetical protein
MMPSFRRFAERATAVIMRSNHVSKPVSGPASRTISELGTNSRKQGMCSGANFSTISIQIASVQTENLFIRY